MLVNLKEILALAERDKKAVGMFNATGFDSLQAIVGAAEELNEPVILAHAEVHNAYNDISYVGPAMLAAAKNASVPVCVHLDHGVTKKMIRKALRIGFTSVMIDASAYPYAENLAITREIAEAAHDMGVSVEAELGRLVTAEGGEQLSGGNASDYYTDPDEAAAFSLETGIDALAVGITFALLPDVNLPAAVSFIGATTFILSAVGLKVGNVFGLKYKSRAEIAGGIILILLGVKILLEHLGVL